MKILLTVFSILIVVCSASFKCSVPGGKCSEYPYVPCPKGYYCSDMYENGTCLQELKLGDNCTELFLSRECGDGLFCQTIPFGNTPGICSPFSYLGIGENCEKDDKCLGTLQCIGSKCTSPTQECQNNFDCPNDQYCDGSICPYNPEDPVCHNTTCKPIKKVGDKCVNINECEINSECHNGVCSPLYSLQKGEECTEHHDLCGESLYCHCDSVDHQIFCKCAQFDSNSLKNCTGNDYRCPDRYLCDTDTNECVYSFLSKTTQCQKAKLQRDQCYEKNDCVNYIEGSSIPYKESCLMKHCEKETLNYNKQCYLREGVCL
ncbi:hypothetical protein DICPUDRAFT_151841 [Dictyostelium purpureum]|uniref:Dickkopf N-terminal cysteine-rich domain-containing protein n=1 Tax=Dictyostelium purpureum TaxID=5786 RepID=F0ZJW3_DICPU|nr:uncharacterized protein DICPUDRAFT_151841 [Dictyostelium purpureum]EGC35764.1 hypothetical protein DICPUDRAFT_151841 [Dictyostelium purpureum]|eukprot:XP_003287716.1 hypothetical protein DICPUDRAFT_151841 [Dictyostelium purpureum]